MMKRIFTFLLLMPLALNAMQDQDEYQLTLRSSLIHLHNQEACAHTYSAYTLKNNELKTTIPIMVSEESNYKTHIALLHATVGIQYEKILKLQYEITKTTHGTSIILQPSREIDITVPAFTTKEHSEQLPITDEENLTLLIKIEDYLPLIIESE